MAKLTPESAWEFADAIKSIVKPQTTRRKATVQSVDKDGTIWVNLPGSSTVTPIQSTGANVSPGDTVLTELRGTSLHITENQTNPAIGENTARSIAKQETQHAEAMAKQAKTIADEANAVAEATNQHFFADDNGAHITDVTQDEWAQAVEDEFSDYDPTTKPYHNQLLNSLGILLRTALNNLVSITRSAIAFYDGTGNAASNIVARFGSTGAQIGQSDKAHMTLTNSSMSVSGGAILSPERFRAGFTNDPVTGIAELTITASLTRVTTIDGEQYYSVQLGGVTPIEATALKVAGNTCDPSDVVFSGALACVKYADYSAYSEETIEITLTTETPVSSMESGTNNDASGMDSVAFGRSAKAQGLNAFASGYQVQASGPQSVALNYTSAAMGSSSLAIGTECKTLATGEHSVAGGISSVVSAVWAFAFGHSAIADKRGMAVFGEYNDNASDTTGSYHSRGKYAFVIGNGTADNARSNALAVTWGGDLYLSNGGKNLLWSGAWFMNASQTITLSKPISEQAFGIVLHWCAYADGAAQNYDNVYQYVPKQHVNAHGGGGVSCFLTNSNGAKVGHKYVYVSDTEITGNANNQNTNTASGISFNNSYWVLTEVIGV